MNLSAIIISVRDRDQEKQISELLRSLELFSELNTEVYFVQDIEEFRGKGPLAGVFSALTAFPGECLFLTCAVDQPFLSPKVLSFLLELGKTNFPKACAFEIFNEGREEIVPFPLVFSSHLMLPLQDFLRRSTKLSFRAFLSELKYKKLLVTFQNLLKIDPECLSLVNINTLEELEAFNDFSSSQRK